MHAGMMMAAAASSLSGGTGGGGGDEPFEPTMIAPYVASTGIHFIASGSPEDPKVFCGDSTCPVASFPVYINGELTSQTIKNLSFSAGDEVHIKYIENADYDHFPGWSGNTYFQLMPGYGVYSASIGFVREWLEPLPLIKAKDGAIFMYAYTSLTMHPVFCNTDCFNVDKVSVPKNFFGNQWGAYAAPMLFSGCSLSSATPADFLAGFNGSAAGIPPMFYDTTLTAVPPALFDGLTDCTSAGSTFSGCTALKTVPTDLFSNCVSLTDVSYCFSGCSALSPVIRFTATGITRATSFANGCAAPAKVYVPAGSTTAATFKKAAGTASNNIGEVIEE